MIASSRLLPWFFGLAAMALAGCGGSDSDEASATETAPDNSAEVQAAYAADPD